MSYRQKLLSDQDSEQNSGQTVHALAFSLKPETVVNNGKQTLRSGSPLCSLLVPQEKERPCFWEARESLSPTTRP